MTWGSVTAAAKTYSNVTSGPSETWADNTVSNTTTRNTSRFALESKITYSGDYVNLQPAVRDTTEGARGGGFYITTADPIALNSYGETL